MSDKQQHLAGLVWSVADLLRSDFKTSEYGSVILPFTVLRRLECVRSAGGFGLKQLATEPFVTANSVRRYIGTFSDEAREVMSRYDFDSRVRQLEHAGVLRQVMAKVADLDLRPEVVSDRQMSDLFDESVRSSAERSAESIGEHFTPPDVVRFIVEMLLAPDAELLRMPGVARTALDPVCGTGSLLSAVEQYVTELNQDALLSLFGQEINSESWAICRSRMMLSGNDAGGIEFGNVFSDDRHPGAQFDYLLANPPFGVEWRRSSDIVQQEHRTLGFAGRFGAGLPRVSDGSLLFLQHMISKMRRGGSRIAIVFTGAPMFAGTAGSGESNIRQWIIENDWLEAIVALPDGLFYNTSIPTYLWTLTNRKSADRQGKIVLLDARDHAQQMRKPLGSKRKYFTSDQVSEIVQLHGDALRAAVDADHPLHDKVRVFSNKEFGYRQIIVDRPLRLRFELSPDALDRLADSRPVQETADPEGLLAALRPLLGSVWTDKAKAFAAVERVVTTSGQAWPTGAAFQKALRDAIGVRDAEGEIQRHRDAPEPDSEQRSVVQLPLGEDPEEYLRREVLRDTPEAWIDHTRTKIGYEISPTLFFRSPLNTQFVPLSQFAQLETTRLSPVDRENKPPYLRAQDLHSVDSAVELPEAPGTGPALTPCAGGDLVGRPGSWRLLPQGFGEAATTLSVLHPQSECGRTLCEWLNSGNKHERFQVGRDLMNLPVPAELVQDKQIDDLLEDVQGGRHALQATIGMLPNVFTDAKADIRGLREDIRSVAAQARLIGELVRPVVDPVWQAEWSYPFHAAALARRYRISTQPAERKDALLKLGEGIARILGILALSEFVKEGRFPRMLRQQFRNGATFGTWLNLIRKFVDEVAAPRMRELSDIKDHRELYSLLEAIKDFRNDSHHAHGVRASHELAEEVAQLEPRVVSALVATNWLSGTHWDWVERCEYLDESSYRLIGQTLRGSHPSWEPFDRSSTYPLKPDRVYVGNTHSGTPVDLWPLAAVCLCTDCRARELFLINEIEDGVVILRSLEEHSMEIPLPRSSATAGDDDPDRIE